MEKKPTLSFTPRCETQVEAVEEPIRQYEPVDKTRIEKRMEYQVQEQENEPTDVEMALENYVNSFIYFSNYCNEKGIPVNLVNFLWQMFMGK